MTYRGKTKSNSPEMDAMAIYNKRVGGYIENKRSEEAKAQREKIFKENAPKGSFLGRAKRFFYNMEKRRLEK